MVKEPSVFEPVRFYCTMYRIFFLIVQLVLIGAEYHELFIRVDKIKEKTWLLSS